MQDTYESQEPSINCDEMECFFDAVVPCKRMPLYFICQEKPHIQKYPTKYLQPNTWKTVVAYCFRLLRPSSPLLCHFAILTHKNELRCYPQQLESFCVFAKKCLSHKN
jgi:hypothetical protein